MEVPAHTHTARRKWTNYFWEFPMLFLAVFCGFLAEYSLEHKIEKDREKQYIRSFIEDLERDTLTLESRIGYCNLVVFYRPAGNPQLKIDSPALLNQIVNKPNYWAAGTTFLMSMLKHKNKEPLN